MKIEKIGNGLKHHITINAKTLQRFNHILDSKYALEFTAFTHCKRNNETGEYLLYDLFIPNQVNTATTTELESDDIIVIDSKNVTAALGILVLKAVKFREKKLFQDKVDAARMSLTGLKVLPS